MMWAKVSSDFLKTDQDVLICNLYIPPVNSTYSVRNAFEEIEQEVLRFSNNYKYIILTGDLNSRTGTDNDFSTILDGPHDFNDILHTDYASMLSNFNMLYKRCSQDTNKNTFGNALLDLGRSNDLFILNGRVEGDKKWSFYM